MPHKKTVKAGERGIVALADNAIEGSVGLVCGFICKLDSEAVERVEMIAGDDSTALEILEILNPLDLFDDKLFIINKSVYELSCSCSCGYIRSHPA